MNCGGINIFLIIGLFVSTSSSSSGQLCAALMELGGLGLGYRLFSHDVLTD